MLGGRENAIGPDKLMKIEYLHGLHAKSLYMHENERDGRTTMDADWAAICLNSCISLKTHQL
jgi:hypothetical protein